MRLSTFISENLEPIMQEWEAFAATVVPNGGKTDSASLRDDAEAMLKAIAADLARPQSAHEQAEKSKGHREDETSAATEHGTDRQSSGFTLVATIAEYRALRASVTRLWQEVHLNKPATKSVIEDLIRFHEAMDQAISESTSSYSEAKEQQTRVYETILSSTPDLVSTFGLDGRFMYANAALVASLGVPIDQILGKKCSDLHIPAGVEQERIIQQIVLTKQSASCEMSYTTTSGAVGWHEYIYVPVLNEDGDIEAVAGTARDITERKAELHATWKNANFDALTGLPNRRRFLDLFERDVMHANRVGAPLALLFIDLDHFKEANDRLGHDAGDQILRLAAERIRLSVRETDTAARLGGDEFMVILQGVQDPKQVEIITEKIRQRLADGFEIGDETAHVSSSIGVTLCPQDASAPEQLIKNADQAMYAAKKAGRNQFCLYSSTS